MNADIRESEKEREKEKLMSGGEIRTITMDLLFSYVLSDSRSFALIRG